jgi:uncharacterized membrane protein
MADVASPAPPRSEDMTRVGVIYALYLLGWISGGVTALVGLVIAYASRASASAKAESHLTFQIRTVWVTFGWALLGGLLVVIGLPLSLVLIGLPIFHLGMSILALLGLLFVVRCVAGILYLARGEDYPRPLSWFF